MFVYGCSQPTTRDVYYTQAEIFCITAITSYHKIVNILRMKSLTFNFYHVSSRITYVCLLKAHCFDNKFSQIYTKMSDVTKCNGKVNGIGGKTPFLIGVAGGTASGKSTVCKRIMEKLGQVDMDHTQRQVVCISQDSFYRDLSKEEIIKAEKGQFNFDHPDAFNEKLMETTLKDILEGRKCEIPIYDYKNHRIKNESVVIYPADVVLFEGILVFYFPEIRNLFHMKLFVDTDSDTRLARRVPRDINERGRDLDQVLHQYMNFVKPAFEEFCSPTKKFADVIIPRGADNLVAIDLIVQHIREFLANRLRTERIVSNEENSFSPTHKPARRVNSGDGSLKRPH